MALLDDVKQALRVNNTALNTEVHDIIDGAKADLELSGVNIIKETDPLIKRAIILYAKSHFGLDNADSDKYMAAFTSLKIHLALSSEYTEVI